MLPKYSKIDLYKKLQKVFFLLAESGEKFIYKFAKIYELEIESIILDYSMADNLQYVPQKAIKDFNKLIEVQKKVLDLIPESMSNPAAHPIRLVWLQTHYSQIKKVIKMLENVQICLSEELLFNKN